MGALAARALLGVFKVCSITVQASSFTLWGNTGRLVIMIGILLALGLGQVSQWVAYSPGLFVELHIALAPLGLDRTPCC